jgi:hypothetical protein
MVAQGGSWRKRTSDMDFICSNRCPIPFPLFLLVLGKNGGSKAGMFPVRIKKFRQKVFKWGQFGLLVGANFFDISHFQHNFGDISQSLDKNGTLADVYVVRYISSIANHIGKCVNVCDLIMWYVDGWDKPKI